MLWLLLACTSGDRPDKRGDDDDDDDTAVDTDVEPTGDTDPVQPPNLVLVVADDLGIDRVAAYGVHPDAPPTPTLSELATEGLRFAHAWTPPACSPTRATLLTGRYGLRTGMGAVVLPKSQDPSFPDDEITLAELLGEVGYSSSFVGKWHVSTLADAHPRGDEPRGHGFDHFVGTRSNVAAYDEWVRWTNGSVELMTSYATSQTTDDAIARIDAMPEPWLLWVAYHAPHSPHHTPPSSLYSGPEPTTDAERFDASVQAWDTELGRLLDAIDLDDTTVVVLGDNGTPPDVVTPPGPPEEQAKGSVYEGGTRVPMFAIGAQVTASEPTSALVSSVDVYATFAELGGASLPSDRVMDGVSFVGVLQGDNGARDHVYTERFEPNGPGVPDLYLGMVRDQRWKLVKPEVGPLELYDMYGVVWEGAELRSQGPLEPDAQVAFDRLQGLIEDLLDSVSAPP